MTPDSGESVQSRTTAVVIAGQKPQDSGTTGEYYHHEGYAKTRLSRAPRARAGDWSGTRQPKPHDRVLTDYCCCVVKHIVKRYLSRALRARARPSTTTHRHRRSWRPRPRRAPPAETQSRTPGTVLYVLRVLCAGRRDSRDTEPTSGYGTVRTARVVRASATLTSAPPSS
jgi:hypothetical protein